MPKSRTLTLLSFGPLQVEPDVLRLQIAVQDAQAVRFVHCRASLAENRDRLVDRRRPAVFQPLGERMAFEVFHHQIGYGLAAGASDAEIGDVDDVRMAQQPDGLRLAPEPLDVRRRRPTPAP